MAATLADLPDAVLAHILRLLPPRSILSFSCSCRALRRVGCREITDVIAPEAEARPLEVFRNARRVLLAHHSSSDTHKFVSSALDLLADLPPSATALSFPSSRDWEVR